MSPRKPRARRPPPLPAPPPASPIARILNSIEPKTLTALAIATVSLLGTCRNEHAASRSESSDAAHVRTLHARIDALESSRDSLRSNSFDLERRLKSLRRRNGSLVSSTPAFSETSPLGPPAPKPPSLLSRLLRAVRG